MPIPVKYWAYTKPGEEIGRAPIKKEKHLANSLAAKGWSSTKHKGR